MIQDYRSSFPEPVNVINIEFGAGLGRFGKIEFPNCFLTDSHDYNVLHVTEVSPGECCHHLDGILNYYNFNFEKRKFNRLVFCNPYEFGFRGKNETLKFLQRAEEILNVEGEIFILGNHNNPWTKRTSLLKNIEIYNERFLKKWRVDTVLTDLQLSDINDRHVFRQTTGLIVRPNYGIILRCD